jgi:hypothetical protein
MRPELLNELDQQGYVEVYKEQIEKYLKVDRMNGVVYLELDIEETNVIFGFKETQDYKEEVIKGRKWLLPTREVKYIKTSDLYFYNTDLKIYFNDFILNSIEDDMEATRVNNFEEYRKLLK